MSNIVLVGNYIVTDQAGRTFQYQTELNRETGSTVTYDVTGLFKKDAVLRNDSQIVNGQKVYNTQLVPDKDGNVPSGPTEKFLLEKVAVESDKQRSSWYLQNGQETGKNLGIPGVRNTANTDDSSSGIDPGKLSTLQTAVDTKLVEGTRTSYDQNVKYPEQLSLENQDCIKFSILEYKPRTLSLALDQQRRKPNFNNAIGSIILPIPAGIGDRNGVSWNDDRIGQLASGFGGAALSYIAGGTDAATSSAQESIDAISGGPGGEKLLEAIIAAKTTEAALGDINVMARQFGAVFNQNLELLFNSPTLRDFTFNFRFTPRSPSEAKIVRKIIRYFKQAMAPKRSTSVLLLKTPHTFGIQYLSSNEDHPYLNKFKECALTNCAVNYTPDGTYMTYSGKLDERSMTAYELNLTFQELEPIFDDDYGNEAEINSIGY